jgi:protocatechuate 3,4-dioxygenase beta subunit
MSSTGCKESSWREGRVDLGRRRTLLGITACATTGLAASDALAQAAACVLTPNPGEGPFYFDPALVRSDIVDGSPGAPLDISLQITRAADCAVLANARVDVWQADGLGLYSGYANQRGVGVPAESAIGKSHLRGTQFTDADGWVRFRTIFPSWYGGRTPHVHFKVLLGDREAVASQVFFSDDVSRDVFARFAPYRDHADRRTVFNGNDPLFDGVLSDVERSDDSGVVASAVVAIDT